jgi:hypothetical protein
MRETTRLEVVLEVHLSVGTRHHGFWPRRREGQVALISAWMASRLELVGMLCSKNLDQHSLILVSTGLRLLVVLAMICRNGSYTDALVVGLVVSTRWLLLVTHVRIKGGWVMSDDPLMVALMV